MIVLYFLSKFNFMAVFFIWWVFLFLLQGFSSSVDGDCHALASYHVVHSQHTWVCTPASPRNCINAFFVPGLGTLACSSLPNKDLQTWLSFGKWEGSRQFLGHCGTEPRRWQRIPAPEPGERSESLGLFFLTFPSSLESLSIPVYSSLNMKGFTLITLVNSC